MRCVHVSTYMETGVVLAGRPLPLSQSPLQHPSRSFQEPPRTTTLKRRCAEASAGVEKVTHQPADAWVPPAEHVGEKSRFCRNDVTETLRMLAQEAGLEAFDTARGAGAPWIARRTVLNGFFEPSRHEWHVGSRLLMEHGSL